MIILETGVQDHYVVFCSRGFMGILHGQGANYPTSIRMILNLAHSEGCMEEFLEDLKKGLKSEMHPILWEGLSLRGLCDFYEFQDVHDFTDHLSEEDLSIFVNTFGDLDNFREGPTTVFV